MPLLVTRAAGANGNGYGALLALISTVGRSAPSAMTAALPIRAALPLTARRDCSFLTAAPTGCWRSTGRVVRDTGPIAGLNLGGGNFGPDGPYYVELCSARTIMAFSVGLDAAGGHVLPPGVAPFPRGFAFGHDGRLFLASGIGHNGQGDNTIVALTLGTATQPARLVADPELSPLDLAIAPNGNIVVSSERPFGAVDAVTSVREYDTTDGRLV
jgi:hypothetical protein